MKKTLPLLVLAALLWACGDDQKDECVVQPDVENVKVELAVEQLEDKLAAIQTKQEVVALFSEHPVIRDFIFRRSEYPNDSVFINRLHSRFTSPHFDTLLQETKRVFGDLSDLRSQFDQAFTNLKYYYPDFTPPKIKTVISGLDTDLYISDTLIVVSLDFYLGKGAKYRPQMYDYLLRQYEKENIVPSCMLIYGIGNRFNKTNTEDHTVLADMIAYGKSYYFAKHMLPCVADSVLIWYTQEEIEGSRKNQDLIWARLVQDQVLYATSHIIKQKYLGERPKTLEVGEKCPGRIAQWVGWQIVNRYMETHPETSLPELMNMDNAQQLFKESNYKPQRR